MRRETDLWDKVHATLALFFLELEGDSTNWTLLDSPHQVSNKSADLIAQMLRGNDCDFFANLLVGLEISGEFGVVFLNNLACSFLDCLSTNASLFIEEKKERNIFFV